MATKMFAVYFRQPKAADGSTCHCHDERPLTASQAFSLLGRPKDLRSRACQHLQCEPGDEIQVLMVQVSAQWNSEQHRCLDISRLQPGQGVVIAITRRTSFTIERTAETLRPRSAGDQTCSGQRKGAAPTA